MNKGFISVIVPIYNVENYIRKCLDSIVAQIYKNIEIILVDDGSTDASGTICDMYAEMDERIKVIHKENGGLSSARNAGLEIATGEIIAFVDSDDYIHPAMYEIMMSILQKTDSDMVICGVCFVNENEITQQLIPETNVLDKSYICIERTEIMSQLVERDLLTVVQWNKLYCKRILEGIRYPTGRYHEDVYVIHRELWNCSRIAYLNAELYYYVQRGNSIMHLESQEMIQDAVDGYEDRIDFMKEMKVEEYKQSIRALLKYIKWKCDSLYDNGFSEECVWLAHCFTEKYNKYINEIEMKEEEKLLAINPNKYFVKRKKANSKKLINLFWKK